MTTERQLQIVCEALEIKLFETDRLRHDDKQLLEIRRKRLEEDRDTFDKIYKELGIIDKTSMLYVDNKKIEELILTAIKRTKYDKKVLEKTVAYLRALFLFDVDQGMKKIIDSTKNIKTLKGKILQLLLDVSKEMDLETIELSLTKETDSAKG